MLTRMFEKRLRGYTAMGYQRRAGAFTQQSPLAVSDDGVKKMAMADRELLVIRLACDHWWPRKDAAVADASLRAIDFQPETTTIPRAGP